MVEYSKFGAQRK